MEVSLYPNFQNQMGEFRAIFACLLNDIFQLIKNYFNMDHFVKDLVTFLRFCRPEIKHQLESANSFDSVSRIIEDKCSITNITLLEAIVDEFSIKEGKQLILKYTQQLQEFCRHLFNNSECKMMATSYLQVETIQFTLNWDVDEHTLKDIRDLLVKAFCDIAHRVEIVTIRECN